MTLYKKRGVSPGDLRYLISWTIRFSAVLAGLGMVAITAYTWFLAFFNGDAVIITINDYGERDFELIVWVLGGPAVGAGLIAVAYSVWREGYGNRKRLKRLLFGNENEIDWL